MILTITPNPAVDQVIEIDEELEGDTVQRGTGTRFHPGGNGVNVSQFIGALGGETVATGVVGGFTGYFIKEELADNDIPTDFTETTTGPTRLNTTILSAEPEGPQTERIQAPGETPKQQFQLKQPGPPVSRETVDELVETVRSHDPEIVYIGGSLPEGMDTDDVDRLAAAGDWKTAVDAPGTVLDQLEGRYEYCRPNQTHLEEATGITIESINDCEKAAIQLQEQGFEHVIASMGEEGAMIVTSEKTLYAPAQEVNVVDVVAAGDALFATILWAHQQGWDDDRSLRAGIAAARELITVSGTTVRTLDVESAMDDVRVWRLEDN